MYIRHTIPGKVQILLRQRPDLAVKSEVTECLPAAAPRPSHFPHHLGYTFRNVFCWFETNQKSPYLILHERFLAGGAAESIGDCQLIAENMSCTLHPSLTQHAKRVPSLLQAAAHSVQLLTTQGPTSLQPVHVLGTIDHFNAYPALRSICLGGDRRNHFRFRRAKRGPNLFSWRKQKLRLSDGRHSLAESEALGTKRDQ